MVLLALTGIKATEYVSSGEGLESFGTIGPDGQISLTFDVPDLPTDHVSGGATRYFGLSRITTPEDRCQTAQPRHIGWQIHPKSHRKAFRGFA